MRTVNMSSETHAETFRDIVQSCELHLFVSRMGSAGVQIVCVALGVLGLIGVIVCCAIPRWKVSSFTGSNIVIAQVMKYTKRNVLMLTQ